MRGPRSFRDDANVGNTGAVAEHDLRDRARERRRRAIGYESQRNIIDMKDVEDGLRAAAAVGDDRLQRMSGARVSPERFTHGSSAQRSRWFKQGVDTGDVFGFPQAQRRTGSTRGHRSASPALTT